MNNVNRGTDFEKNLNFIKETYIDNRKMIMMILEFLKILVNFLHYSTKIYCYKNNICLYRRYQYTVLIIALKLSDRALTLFMELLKAKKYV